MAELYHWEPNSFYLKPLIALKEKGVAYTSHYVDPTRLPLAGLPPLNLEAATNPEVSGPILVNNGETIAESFFMLEYIDEAFPDSIQLMPRTPLGDWEIRVWARFLGESTAPAVSTLGCQKYLIPAVKAQRANATASLVAELPSKEQQDAWAPIVAGGYPDALLEDSKRKVGIAIKRVEDALAKGDWLLGTEYSVADIEAFALFNALPTLVPDLLNADAAPLTTAWIARMRARSAVAAALAESRTGKPEEAFAPGPEHARWG